MIEVLKSKTFRLEVDTEKGKFSLFPLDEKLPTIKNNSLQLFFSAADILDGEVKPGGYERKKITKGPLGAMEMLTIWMGPDPNGLFNQVEFALTKSRPLMLWRWKIANQGEKPLKIDRMEMLNLGQGEKQFVVNNNHADLAFYANGWQSWSYTCTYGKNEKTFLSRLGVFQDALVINKGTPQHKKAGKFAADFFGVIGDRHTDGRNGLVVGFLSQKEHFGTLEVDLNKGPAVHLWVNGDGTRLEPGAEMSTDWAVICPVYLDDAEPLETYLDAVAREYQVKVKGDSPSGWCSWYHYYQNLKANDVRKNLCILEGLKDKLPLELVQIDDGFELQVGDWFKFRDGFKEGVAPLAKEIRQAGMKAGLWLAPFILHPDARIIKEHPDWILRDTAGKPVNAGFIWNRFTTALDLTVPEALDYACKVVSTAAHEWGFPYLKLDFLYAGALDGVHRDRTKTRAKILREALEAIRAAAGPDVYLLGCGAPFGSSIGLFEAMRIGADVSGNWVPAFMGMEAFFNREPTMPSARNSIQNILTRAMLHKTWWINDPDCLLLRTNTNLTLSEVQSLASAIGMTGGSLLISDDLTELPLSRLKIAQALFPVVGQKAEVLDWFDARTPQKLRLSMKNETGEWVIAAWFNWKDTPSIIEISPTELKLDPLSAYWVSDFWGEKVSLVGENQNYQKIIDPHGCCLTAWRKADLEQAQYIGGNLHFSQGLELKSWYADCNEIRCTISLNRSVDGYLTLSIPGNIKAVVLGQEPAQWHKLNEKIYRIPVLGSSGEHYISINW
jgi:alpha-galactosidase